MPFNKSSLKKTLDIDEEGYSAEVITVAFQYEILRGETYEDARAHLIQRLDERFSQMFAAELGTMPQRLNEGEQWQRGSLFADDAISQAVTKLHEMGAVIGR